jgi:hypothetical protein
MSGRKKDVDARHKAGHDDGYQIGDCNASVTDEVS